MDVWSCNGYLMLDDELQWLFNVHDSRLGLRVSGHANQPRLLSRNPQCPSFTQGAKRGVPNFVRRRLARRPKPPRRSELAHLIQLHGRDLLVGMVQPSGIM